MATGFSSLHLFECVSLPRWSGKLTPVEEGRSARKLLGAAGSCRVAAKEPGPCPAWSRSVLRHFPRNSAHGQPGARRARQKGEITPVKAVQGKEQPNPSAAHGTGTRGAARPGRGASVGSGGSGKREVPKGAPPSSPRLWRFHPAAWGGPRSSGEGALEWQEFTGGFLGISSTSRAFPGILQGKHAPGGSCPAPLPVLCPGPGWAPTGHG